PLDKVVQLPIDALLDRTEVIASRDQKPDRLQAAAVLGTKQPPVLTVTQALETYWALAKDKTFWQKRRSETALGEPAQKGCPEFCEHRRRQADE
ncbi:MAG: integrase, partial [Paracoccaceae bacterium]